MKRARIADSFIVAWPRAPSSFLNSGGVSIFIIDQPPFLLGRVICRDGISAQFNERGCPKNDMAVLALDIRCHSTPGALEK